MKGRKGKRKVGSERDEKKKERRERHSKGEEGKERQGVGGPEIYISGYVTTPQIYRRKIYL